MITQQIESKKMRRRPSTRVLVLAIAAVAILTVALAYRAMPFLTNNPSTAPPNNNPGSATNLPTITFDFDTGSPLLTEGQNTPLVQTSKGLTAHFSSTSDLASPAFSVQSYDTTFFKLSEFSGKWLYDNKPSADSLDIMFDHELTSISLVFATLEYHGGPSTEPSNITLTAYMNSTDTTPVGSATAHGTFSSELFPQGTLSFNSGGQPFNLVRIEIHYQGPQRATDFLVDNIRVLTSHQS